MPSLTKLELVTAADGRMTRLFFIDDDTERDVEARREEGDVREMQHRRGARFLLLRRGRVRAHGQGPMRIAWHERRDIPTPDEDAFVFLGFLDGRPCFAVVPEEAPLSADDRFRTGYGTDAEGFVGLYDAAMGMPPAEARLAARAVHFANWINRTRYCGACGARMRPAAGGRKRACTRASCAREEFPRTDPVVIVLVTHGSRCLLGRQPRFPPGRYSPIAGFVEPGEPLEAAVRREVGEEAGVDVARVVYCGSQPWPFPTSLMVGFLAEATGDAIRLNDGELEDARWFERSDIAAWLAAEAGTAPVALSPPGVMARRLIEHWLSGPA